MVFARCIALLRAFAHKEDRRTRIVQRAPRVLVRPVTLP